MRAYRCSFCQPRYPASTPTIYIKKSPSIAKTPLPTESSTSNYRFLANFLLLFVHHSHHVRHGVVETSHRCDRGGDDAIPFPDPTLLYYLLVLPPLVTGCWLYWLLSLLPDKTSLLASFHRPAPLSGALFQFTPIPSTFQRPCNPSRARNALLSGDRQL